MDIGALEQDINMDFEENSPCQEGAISETYQRPDTLNSACNKKICGDFASL